jgi:PmbA protein
MIEKLIKFCKNENINIEVKTKRSEGYNINVFNGEVKKNESFITLNYTIKATQNGKTIKLNTSSINNTKEIIKVIKNNIKALDSKDENSFAKNQNLPIVKNTKEDINITEVLNKLLELENLKKENKYLSNIEVQYSYNYDELSIVNEEASLNDEYGMHNFAVELIITKNGINQTSRFFMTSKTFEFDKFKNNIIEKIKEAEDKIDASSYESDKYNIVLKNSCVFTLLNRLARLFYAENINKNLSCLTGKFNEKIFSDKITIIEDPSNEKYVGKRLFDDEGTKTTYKEIIKNGVFKCKLYDNKNALKENRESTGNSFGVRNMYIEKGNLSFEELLKKCNNGVLIDTIEGLHAGLDEITGEFSLQAQGYVIENGKLTKTLKLIILSSNVFEIFSNAEEIGNDLEFNNINGGAPSLLINNISISGSKMEV